jgi:hypothetical protein
MIEAYNVNVHGGTSADGSGESPGDKPGSIGGVPHIVTRPFGHTFLRVLVGAQSLSLLLYQPPILLSKYISHAILGLTGAGKVSIRLQTIPIIVT